MERVASLPQKLMPPTLSRLWGQRDLAGALLKVGLRRKGGGPVLESRMQPARLSDLPVLTTWSRDGGPFVSLQGPW